MTSLGVKIAFPIVAELAGQMVRQYGMIQPGASSTATVRATFTIDPSGTIRAMACHP